MHIDNSQIQHVSTIERTPLYELSPDVAERIAAGEVIERPVSVAMGMVLLKEISSVYACDIQQVKYVPSRI